MRQTQKNIPKSIYSKPIYTTLGVIHHKRRGRPTSVPAAAWGLREHQGP